jgi:hypothetical protein
MSPLPVPPHANSVLATGHRPPATATGIQKSGEPAPAGAWPISMGAAGPPANALRERHSVPWRGRGAVGLLPEPELIRAAFLLEEQPEHAGRRQPH